jgi:hypothetical protein
MNTKFALSIAALGFAGLAQLAHADSIDFAQPANTEVPTKLTRAEVRADLALWRRAGLDTVAQLDGYTVNSDETEQRMALYRQWRSGPEFLAELSRQQGQSNTTAKAPSAQSVN